METSSRPSDSVQRAARFAEQVAATHQPDVMVLGELLNVIAAPGTYDSKAETIPGPSTDVMAGVARSYGVNIAFGLLERDGVFIIAGLSKLIFTLDAS